MLISPKHNRINLSGRIMLALSLLSAAGCWGPTSVAGPSGGFSVPNEAQASMAPTAADPAPWDGPVPDALAGTSKRDFVTERFSGGALTIARRQSNQDRSKLRAATYKLAAFGTNAGWTSGGINGLSLETDFSLPNNSVATNGPAYAYRGATPKLADRAWFLCTNGWLLGVKTQDPKGSGDNAPIKIDLGKTVSNGFVTLSDDGSRAYVVSDDGYLNLAKLDTGTVTSTTIDTGASAAVGMAAFMDPLLTNPRSLVGQDVLFCATNAGKVVRFDYNGTLTRGTVKTGVGITTAIDGSTTNLLKATPVALNGVLYYGDRGGNINTFAYGSGTLSTVALNTGYPIETMCALDLNDTLSVNHIFAAAGPHVAWVDVTTPSAPVFSLSQAALLDSANGGAVSPAAGPLSGMAATGTAVSAAQSIPTYAATALVADTPPSSLVLTGNDGSGVKSIRNTSLGGAQVLDQNVPQCNTVYGVGGTAGDTTNYSKADQGTGSGSRTRFNVPLDVCFGPDGEAYMGGKNGNNATIVKMVASKDMAVTNNQNGWGYTNAGLNGKQSGAGETGFQANRTYLIPGNNAGNFAPPSPAYNQPHAVFYDNNNTTADTSDDNLWVAEWQGNYVRRIRRDTGAVTTWNNGNTASGPHGITRVWGVAGANNGAVFYTTSDNQTLHKITNPTSGSPTFSTAWTGPAGSAPTTNIFFMKGPNDGAQGSIYIPSRSAHVVYKYDVASGTATQWCGTFNNNSGTPVVDGTPVGAAARLNQPETITGNPITGDVFIGENAGMRLKVVYGSGPSANRLYTLAGDGGSTYNGDGKAGPNVGLGWISGLRLGPPDLTNPTVDPYKSVYLDSRDAHVLMRFDFPDSTPATAKSVMRWSLTANHTLLNSEVRFTSANTINAVDGAGNPTTVPRLNLVLANTNFSAAPGGLFNEANMTPNNVPSHNPNIVAPSTTGGPDTPQTFTINSTTMTYRLPTGSLPTDGNLAMALVPPDNGYTYHYAHANQFNWSATDRTSPDYCGRSDGTPSRRPTLSGRLVPRVLEKPILSPPAIFNDGAVKYVYIVNTNGLFRLDFSSIATWTTGAAYCATRLGRNNNGTFEGAFADPKPWIANPTPPLMTYNGSAFVLDRMPTNTGRTNWNFSLNRFNGIPTPMTWTNNTGGGVLANTRFDGVTTTGDASSTGNFAVADTFGEEFGWVYFGLGNNTDGRIYRISMN